MINYKLRSTQKEILDQKNIPFEDIALNMRELDFINSNLGGHRITIDGFKYLLQKRKKISVCEIGCGGGDNLNAINEFCTRNNIQADFIGIDINPECIDFAKTKSKIKDIDFIVKDYRDVDFANHKPDIIFTSLFCHHFTDDELVEMIQRMNENSNIGFFINDLHRNSVAYHFIKYATKLFSKSYLTKNDAPISVLRGFTKKEWQIIFKKAKVKVSLIQWKWAFRYLVIVQKNAGLNN
ncbi:MAG: methyltransferase domain-containing protein [Ginsengibacter sp.]